MLLYSTVMFARLFAESGLSLDRVRALLEVGASGSIVKAASGDPVRQSQYSRQIKELEEFFQSRLVERHGKGIRLTANGRELARISRFFLLGLSNFQRGCLTEEQTFRFGAEATFIQCFLLPALATSKAVKTGITYTVEIAAGDEIERRLHDLTLDFAVTTRTRPSRPLQVHDLGQWGLNLWVPKVMHKSEKHALRVFAEKRLAMAVATAELDPLGIAGFKDHDPVLVCPSFVAARVALSGQALAAVLPDFLQVENRNAFLKICLPADQGYLAQYVLCWNPRMLRLNPHAIRRRDFFAKALAINPRKAP
jgi:DNA-binding transcriptional LysR family regulator